MAREERFCSEEGYYDYVLGRITEMSAFATATHPSSAVLIAGTLNSEGIYKFDGYKWDGESVIKFLQTYGGGQPVQ